MQNYKIVNLPQSNSNIFILYNQCNHGALLPHSIDLHFFIYNNKQLIQLPWLQVEDSALEYFYSRKNICRFNSHHSTMLDKYMIYHYFKHYTHMYNTVTL